MRCDIHMHHAHHKSLVLFSLRPVVPPTSGSQWMLLWGIITYTDHIILHSQIVNLIIVHHEIYEIHP